ncbi:methylated-DNA-[protein]-cysteine S-methyltransferase [Desulfotomaculum arcticum]|uniref:methylated-DNA--[protein]-cysteine S-methyltransferase n=1 Tax=Desulfotruncus arcticus DSM 17038 TaxID=1121424 RepID=A0A1I2YX88_9FIRM|nr:methylated-DNA--[protein]-cysteine S-methyltransferase [Desulfotruncus arcticus]SFH29889.1 methylated-DNA-[protein]-cysteine S-methyltransferase [Desulfotomaculum arcticum] [Desulfotruncus arcticus DSM 17038]
MLVFSVHTAAGWLSAAFSKKGLAALTLPAETKDASIKNLEAMGISAYSSMDSLKQTNYSGFDQQLQRYFDGEPEKFEIAVDWSVFTPFRQKILKVVRDIPYGTVLSYGQVANLAGCPRANRAVGGALGSNKILIIIPCHRVIYGDGTPGGFGSGLQWKSHLLALEGLAPGPGGKYPLAEI